VEVTGDRVGAPARPASTSRRLTLSERARSPAFESGRTCGSVSATRTRRANSADGSPPLWCCRRCPSGCHRPHPGCSLLDRQQAARDQLLARLLIAIATQPSPGRRGRRTWPGAVLAAGEARQRQRDQALTDPRSARASTAAIACRVIHHTPRSSLRICSMSPSAASRNSTPVPPRTKSFGFGLDPPQLLAQLTRGSKRLRDRGTAAVARQPARPTVARSTLEVHLPGAIELRGGRCGHDGRTVPGPRSAQRGPQPRQSHANGSTKAIRPQG